MYKFNLLLVDHATEWIKMKSRMFLPTVVVLESMGFMTWQAQKKRWKAKLAALVKSQLQNNITDKGGRVWGWWGVVGVVSQIYELI